MNSNESAPDSHAGSALKYRERSPAFIPVPKIKSSYFPMNYEKPNYYLKRLDRIPSAAKKKRPTTAHSFLSLASHGEQPKSARTDAFSYVKRVNRGNIRGNRTDLYPA